jgi:hypothetical protein
MTAWRRNDGRVNRARIGGQPGNHPESIMVLCRWCKSRRARHLTRALCEPVTRTDNEEWLLLRLDILKKEIVPAIADTGLGLHLEEHAAAVARAAVATERTMAESVRSGVHHETAFAAVYSARQFCLDAAAWFDKAIAAGGVLHAVR